MKKINRLDAFFLYRILLGRNPTPEENKNICSLNITFQEYLDSIVNSQEYSKSTCFMPPGHEFMSELKDFKFYFNTSDHEMSVKMAIDDY
jgi:hypothetical protein